MTKPEEIGASVVEQLIFEPEQYVDVLLRKISESSRQILISMYILESDNFGNKIIEALKEKANQGVDIKLLLDGYGSWGWNAEYAQDWVIKNFEIRIFHPLPWPASRVFSSARQWRQPGKLFERLNRRNHQKIFVFDEQSAIVGSRNLFDEALKWRETNILFQGPAVKETISVFENLWQRSHDPRFRRKYSPHRHKFTASFNYIITNHLLMLRRKPLMILQKKILEARDHIYLTTPYFFPPRKIFRAILQKAKEGVTVKILVPQSSDVTLSKWVNQSHYALLLNAGAEVYEYKPRILHAKSFMIDEWALVASSNFNQRGMYQDIELDYILTQKKTVDDLQSRFFRDIGQSVRIEKTSQIGFLKKWIAEIMTYFFPRWF